MKLWGGKSKKSCFYFFFAEMGHFRNFGGIKGNERFSREFEPVTKGNASWRLAGMLFVMPGCVKNRILD